MLLFAPDGPINQFIHRQINRWTIKNNYTEFSDNVFNKQFIVQLMHTNYKILRLLK